MFKLTKEEQWAVVFLVGAILLGTAVRQWRMPRPAETNVAAQGARE
jgi:hypothetical protein